jgi:hypothetical protein
MKSLLGLTPAHQLGTVRTWQSGFRLLASCPSTSFATEVDAAERAPGPAARAERERVFRIVHAARWKGLARLM